MTNRKRYLLTFFVEAKDELVDDPTDDDLVQLGTYMSKHGQSQMDYKVDLDRTNLVARPVQKKS